VGLASAFEEIFRLEVGEPDADKDVDKEREETTDEGEADQSLSLAGVSPEKPAHFSDLYSFLCSDFAVETLGKEAVDAMRLEYEDTKAKQTYFLDKLERLQSMSSERDLKVPGERSRALSQSHSCEYEATGHAFAPIPPHLPASFGLAQQGVWTLWSLQGASELKKQAYHTEVDGRRAFMMAGPGPCVLRDAFDREVISRSWVQLQPRYLGQVFGRSA